MRNGTSPYKADERRRFRQLLLRRRKELLESLHALEQDVKEYNEPPAAGVSTAAPTHPGEESNRAFEQTKDLQIASTDRDMVIEIDEALRRIDDKTYGRCLACGKPIERRRLKAKPWARLCIDDARRMASEP